ncbi:phosphatidate cytidylyltransferase [Candidatus Saccharibacteria bacterium]|nr:phosphatidate cytidylyltransferase [Candidatus Saccharibacteria bacterium]
MNIKVDKNFKVRVSVGVGMFAVALVGLYTFEAVPFKVIYGVFSLISLIELMSFFKRRFARSLVMLALVEAAFLVMGTVFVAMIDPAHFWYIILGVPGYDIFAYLFGKMLGGRLVPNSRPFPTISKNKTWEGTVCGLLASIGMVLGFMAAREAFATEWMYLFCGPLALVGDLFESFLKRQFKVKDSNEIVIKNKFFRALENLVGGSEGHGGFLDRVDSTAFATSVLLIIKLVGGV